MADHDVAVWWVCYDIHDPRRSAKILKRLKGVGIPLQYSLFEVRKSAQGMKTLMDELAALAAEDDDLRAYRCSGPDAVVRLGRSLVPDGMWLPEGR